MWKPTDFEDIDRAYQVALALDMRPVWQSEAEQQGLRCFKCWTDRQPSLVAQRLEGGPVLQKQLPRKRRRSRSAYRRPVPLPEDKYRFAGYARYFAHDWRWTPAVKSEYTGKPIVEGIYRVYPGPFNDTLVEVLEVKGELYQRVLSPSEEVRQDAQKAKQVTDRWKQEMRKRGHHW